MNDEIGEKHTLNSVPPLGEKLTLRQKQADRFLPICVHIVCTVFGWFFYGWHVALGSVHSTHSTVQQLRHLPFSSDRTLQDFLLVPVVEGIAGRPQPGLWLPQNFVAWSARGAIAKDELGCPIFTSLIKFSLWSELKRIKVLFDEYLLWFVNIHIKIFASIRFNSIQNIRFETKKRNICFNLL
jgi:hypothetical protein